MPTITKRKRAKPVPKREAVKVKIGDLTPHPKNYRTHSADQIEHIKASIRTNGVYRNVIVAKDNVILGGHGVVQAAHELGLKIIPVIKLPWGSNDPRSLKVLAGDNEISRLASVDDRALTNVLKEIKDTDGFDLIGTGFSEQMLAALVMVTRTTDEIHDFDAAAHWVGMPEHDPGEKKFVMTIQFRNEDDRAAFIKQSNIKDEDLICGYAGGRTWSTWWPPKETNDQTSIRFEESSDGDEAIS